MYECERVTHQLDGYYALSSSTLNFLQKYLVRLHKAFITYSTVLKTIHTKSMHLLTQYKTKNEFYTHLYHAFSSLAQTFDDEYHQFEQRARLVAIVQLTIEHLQQRMHTSMMSRQKHKLYKCTYRIVRLTRNKKQQQQLYKLARRTREHDMLTLTWKENLDILAAEITNLVWKLFSYSPYKFDVLPNKTPSISKNVDLSIVKVAAIQTEPENLSQTHLSIKTHEVPLELGSGDQLHSPVMTKSQCQETILYELDQQQHLSNSNNAVIATVRSSKNDDETRSLYSTDIDETIVQKNQLLNDPNVDEEAGWTSLVIQNQCCNHDIQWQETINTFMGSTLSISTDESVDDNDSIKHRKKSIVEKKTRRTLRISDISYMTDYYSQNESN